MKTCTLCHVKKEMADFHVKAKAKDGRNSWCKVCCKGKQASSYKQNAEAIKSRTSAYYYANKDAINAVRRSLSPALNKKYRERLKATNPELQKERWRLASQKRLEKPENRIKHNLRMRMNHALKNGSKKSSILALIGCTLPELMCHLEKQFTEGMGWENYTHNGWHVDHIAPCSVFDLTNIEQQRKCFHYSNLQPLWQSDNSRKSNKVLLRLAA